MSKYFREQNQELPNPEKLSPKERELAFQLGKRSHQLYAQEKQEDSQRNAEIAAEEREDQLNQQADEEAQKEKDKVDLEAKKQEQIRQDPKFNQTTNKNDTQKKINKKKKDQHTAAAKEDALKNDEELK